MDEANHERLTQLIFFASKMKLIKDYRELSDREIARRIGCSYLFFVDDVKDFCKLNGMYVNDKQPKNPNKKDFRKLKNV